MIIVPVKEGENIEKALKKFKRKFEKTAPHNRGIIKIFPQKFGSFINFP